MLILGIDPGSRATGLGLVRYHGNRLSYVDCEVVRPPAGELASRLSHIYARLTQRLQEWAPDGVAVEAVFSHRNPRSALQLGQARGAALAACGAAGLGCAEYPPTQVKQAVAGTGAADKSQIQTMVCRLLGLAKAPASDAADALAVAICHGQLAATPGADRIAQALVREGAR